MKHLASTQVGECLHGIFRLPLTRPSRSSSSAAHRSFGTHFLQDLVEASIRYAPLFPDDPDIRFHEAF